MRRKSNRRLRPKNFIHSPDDYFVHPTKGFRRDSRQNRATRRIGEAKLRWFKDQGKKNGQEKTEAQG